MTHLTRHVNAIKEKIAELIDKLFSFFSLTIMGSAEALFLFIFTRVHEQVHDYFDHSPWCPMKIAVIIMGASLLLLNVVIVLTFVATEILRTVRSLRSSLGKKRCNNHRKARTNPIPNYGREAQAGSLPISEAGHANVMITLTVAHESDDITISSVRLPLLGKSLMLRA